MRPWECSSNPDAAPGLEKLRFHGGADKVTSSYHRGSHGRKKTEQVPDPADGLVMMERLIRCPGKTEEGVIKGTGEGQVLLAKEWPLQRSRVPSECP